MTFRELQYLIAVADQRNFRRAAEICFVSQPTLSTQIRKLEEELCVTLIERAPRRIMLTPVGQQIVDRARRVMAEADAIRETARRAAAPEAGSLRLGLFPTLGPYLLPHIVPGLRRRFPQLELLLVEEKSELLLDRLRSGALDAALLALPVSDDQLCTEILFDEPFVLAVPAGHAFARGRAPVPEDLAGQNLMLLEEGHCLRAQALEVCSLTGARETVGFRATSLETLRQMVAAGVGMTLLPMLATMPPVAPLDSLCLRTFAGHSPSRRIAMVWRKTSALHPLLGAMAEEIRTLTCPLLLPDAPKG